MQNFSELIVDLRRRNSNIASWFPKGCWRWCRRCSTVCWAQRCASGRSARCALWISGGRRSAPSWPQSIRTTNRSPYCRIVSHITQKIYKNPIRIFLITKISILNHKTLYFIPVHKTLLAWKSQNFWKTVFFNHIKKFLNIFHRENCLLLINYLHYI